MGSLEDLWPLVEKYLGERLLNENLSDLAEQERTDLLEKIEIAKLPPSLPPRPEEGIDQIAKLREESRKKFTRTLSAEGDECGQLYDDINFDINANGDADEIGSAYEEPQGQKREYIAPAEESDSGTSYEDYEEDEFDSDEYTAPKTEEIKLPRVKSKKRPRKYGGLENITFSGELSCKSLFGTEQKACVIQDRKLLVFKNDRAKKAQEQIDIDAYEAVYFDRDGKHQHVIRLKRPNNAGGNEHWFCAESKEKASEWLQYLNTKEGDKASLGSKDSNSFHDSGTQSQNETPAQSGSEGGSGDGQVPYTGQDPADLPSPPPTAGKTKDIRKKSIGEKILSTIGKKSGAKTANKLEVIDVNFEADPESLVAGCAQVMSEAMMGNKSWHKLYCHVKDNSLECFKKAGDDKPEFSMSLKGLTMDPANINKHPLAYRLSQGEKPKLFIEPPDIIEQGKWLNVLIKETGCGSPQTKKAPFSSDETDHAVTEDVYHDVYDHRVSPLKRAKGTPPPLPKNPPPVRTPPSIKRIFGQSGDSENEQMEAEGMYDDVVHDRLRHQQRHSDSDDDEANDDTRRDTSRQQQLNGADVGNDVSNDENSNDQTYDDVMEPNNNRSEKTDGAFVGDLAEYKNTPTEIVEYKNTPSELAQVTELESGAGKAKEKQEAKKQVDALIKRLKANEQTRKLNSQEKQEPPADPNVIRCSTGPTIAADEDILKSTANPILSELRSSAGKTWSTGEKEKVESEISELKKRVGNLRKQRKDMTLAQIRSKKLNTGLASEKAAYEQQLQELDKEMEEAQAQLTRLRLIEQEKNAASSRGNSPAPSPRSSFNKGTSRPAVGKSHAATKTSAPRTSASNTKSSAPLLMPVITSAKTSTTTTLRTTRVSQVTASKVSTLPAKTSTTEQPSWRSNKAADKTSDLKTSAYSWRSDASTTKASTLPREVTSLSKPRSADGVKTAGAKKEPRQTVQDKLKMWESIADSNC